MYVCSDWIRWFEKIIILNSTQFKIRVCLEFVYFAEIENFFVENTVDKGKI